MHLPSLPSTPDVARVILRVPLGVCLMLLGLSAYVDFGPFVASMTDGMAWATPLATLWALVLPLLLIVGGGILASCRYPEIAGITAGIGLASVPIGLVLRSIIGGIPLPDTIAAAYPSILWLVALAFAIGVTAASEAKQNDSPSPIVASSL